MRNSPEEVLTLHGAVDIVGAASVVVILWRGRRWAAYALLGACAAHVILGAIIMGIASSRGADIIRHLANLLLAAMTVLHIRRIWRSLT